MKDITDIDRQNITIDTMGDDFWDYLINISKTNAQHLYDSLIHFIIYSRYLALKKEAGIKLGMCLFFINFLAIKYL